MEHIREYLEVQQRAKLNERATRSTGSGDRLLDEEPCEVRTPFQVDRDRILHSKSFRRLKQKTQVFLAPAGDHYRTRLTHTLEVSQIGRTIATALGLNDDLVEAISLGHDLGHTPFGHAGEAVLNRLAPDGFHHAAQSLRVVDKLEKDGEGLNLTREVREGILFHTKGKGKILSSKATLEAQVVRISDVIAYLNHDLDDALRAGVVQPGELPGAVADLGSSHGKRIGALVKDVIGSTLDVGLGRVAVDERTEKTLEEYRDFLYERVYENPTVHADFIKANQLLEELYVRALEDEEWFVRVGGALDGADPHHVKVVDFIAGMTDRFAIKLFEKTFMPQPWKAD